MSSIKEGQKVILEIVRFLSKQGHFHEMHTVLLLGQKDYGFNVDNKSLEKRLEFASAGNQKKKVIVIFY